MASFADFVNFAPGFEIPDIRNGALDTITEVIPRAAIPNEYKWMGIVGLPPAQRMQRLEATARIHFAYIRAINNTIPADVARDQAIVLASIRTGATIAYALQAADMSGGEVGPGVATYRPPVAAVAEDLGATPPVHAVAAVAEGINLAWGAATAAAAQAAWAAWNAMTEAEQSVATFHVILGMPIPVCQGWSIVKSGHHFLSNPAQNMRQSWDAIIRQYNQKTPQPVKNWISARAAWWEDIAFHKACHPIEMSVKVALAQSADIAAKIKKAGWGSAAVRLPATEPDFEFAKVVLALAQKVTGTITGMGGTVSTANLEGRVNNVLAAANAPARAAAIQTAVTFAHTNDSIIAYMAGILDAIVIASGGAPSTILRSIGLRRVMANEPEAVTNGVNDFRAFAARRRDEIAAGRITPVNVNI